MFFSLSLKLAPGVVALVLEAAGVVGTEGGAFAFASASLDLVLSLIFILVGDVTVVTKGQAGVDEGGVEVKVKVKVGKQGKAGSFESCM